MFKRLRVKLTLFCAVVTAVIVAAMSLLSLVLTENTLKQRGSASFATDVNAVIYYLSGQKMLDHTWLSQTEANGKMMLYLEDGGAPMLFSGSWDRGERDRVLSAARELALREYDFDIGTAPENPLKSSQMTFSFTDVSGEYYAAAARVPFAKGWVGLIVAKPMSAEKAEIAELRVGYALLAAISVALLFLFAWFFTGRAIRPVEESRRRQMEFVAAASHELRSPLAVITSSTSAALEAPPEKARRFGETVLGECGRMSRLIGDMLLLAGADNRSWSIHKAPVEPETLLLNVAESFESAAAVKSITLRAVLPDTTFPRCQWDEQRIVQVLAILLDNALSYTPAGGRVELSAARRHERLELRVADSGPGIPEEHRKDIFRRFYRLDASRTQKEHYGLGLSIAMEITVLHQGTLRVEDAAGGGSVFVLSLPTGQF